jgi:hypothetical protein
LLWAAADTQICNLTIEAIYLLQVHEVSGWLRRNEESTNEEASEGRKAEQQEKPAAMQQDERMRLWWMKQTIRQYKITATTITQQQVGELFYVLFDIILNQSQVERH